MLFPRFQQWLLIGIFVFGFCNISHGQDPNVDLTGNPARFLKVTEWTKARWGIQTVLAPKTLYTVVPMYAYKLGTWSDNEDYAQHIANFLTDGDGKNIDYVALLPPKSENNPAECGIPLLDGGRSAENINKIFEGTDEILRRYRNCSYDEETIGNLENWYIAGETTKSKYFQKSSDNKKNSDPSNRILLWTNKNAWSKPDSVAQTP